MFCTKCGAEIINDIYFCAECNNDMSRFCATESTDTFTHAHSIEIPHDNSTSVDFSDMTSHSNIKTKPKRLGFFKKLVFVAILCFLVSFLYFRTIAVWNSTNLFNTNTFNAVAPSTADDNTADLYDESPIDYSEFTAFILLDSYDAGNLRAVPSLDSEVLTVVYENDVMYYMNEEQHEAEHSITWCKVYHENSGLTGWISKKLLDS